MPDVQLSDLGRKQEQRPQAVGFIDLRDRRVTGGFSMAIDALHSVMLMLFAGRFKYLVLDGEAMRYRKARIRHYRFETKLDVADYPDD